LSIDSAEENHFMSNIFMSYTSSNTDNFWYTAGMKIRNSWTWEGKLMHTDKWMSVPGQKEPVNKRLHRCLALTNKPSDTRAEDLDYYFWRAMPCIARPSQLNGLRFVCQRKKGKAVKPKRQTTTQKPTTTPTKPIAADVTVRLVGPSPHAGTVEVTRSGVTGVICDDEWDLQDGHVVCRMLGFRSAVKVTERNVYDYVMKKTKFVLDDVNCTGSEDNLAQCQHKPWGTNNCVQTEVAGVECLPNGNTGMKSTTPRPTKPTIGSSSIFDVQLVGGKGSHEGNVEILYKGRKYRICDDGWGEEEASVICRMLGFRKGGFPTERSHFGTEKMHILFDDVKCTGREESFVSCKAVVGINKHDCLLGRENAGVVCIKNVEVEEPHTGPPPVYVPGQCGYRHEEIFSRKRRSSQDLITPAPPAHHLKIFHGDFAHHGEFPWQARVKKSLSRFLYVQHCGAVIISDYWLLSAAHCFINKRKSSFKIAVGDHDTRNPDEGEQNFQIEELILHENYKYKGKHDDIALIKIRPNKPGQGMTFNKFVQPACLPTRSTAYKPGTNCYISGWGKTESKSTPYLLKATKVPIWGHDQCDTLLGHKIPGGLDEGMMCAGHIQGGGDTCQGDSGGPLVCNNRGSFTVFGLTSFGYGCGRARSPGVYAKVQYYLSWIEEKIAQHSHTEQQKRMPQRA